MIYASSFVSIHPSTLFPSLSQLTAVNDKMAEYTNAPGAAALNAALMHTLQRHRDILQVCCLVPFFLSVFYTLFFLYLNEIIFFHSHFSVIVTELNEEHKNYFLKHILSLSGSVLSRLPLVCFSVFPVFLF